MVVSWYLRIKLVRKLLVKQCKGKTYDVWRRGSWSLKADLTGRLRKRKIDITRSEEVGKRQGFERGDLKRWGLQRRGLAEGVLAPLRWSSVGGFDVRLSYESWRAGLMKGRADRNQGRSEGTEWEVPGCRSGRNQTGQKWCVPWCRGRLTGNANIRIRCFRVWHRPRVRILRMDSLVTSQVQTLMSMQLSRLLTTLVRWGLEGNGPELIPTRYRAIGNLRLAESRQPHASFGRHGLATITVFHSILVCLPISSRFWTKNVSSVWGVLVPSAIWRVDYGSLECEILGIFGTRVCHSMPRVI